MRKILSVFNKQDAKILRQPTKEISDPSDSNIWKLIEEMKDVMRKMDGVGLAANQVGENYQIFVAEYQNKSFAFINPKIIKYSKEMDLAEEGCLSVPGIIGIVPRYRKVVIESLDKKGKKVKIKAKDMLARIFQHEIDHLNGVLFIDKAKKIYKVSSSNAL